MEYIVRMYAGGRVLVRSTVSSRDAVQVMPLFRGLCHSLCRSRPLLTPYPGRANPGPGSPKLHSPLSHVALGMGLLAEHLILYPNRLRRLLVSKSSCTP